MLRNLLRLKLQTCDLLTRRTLSSAAPLRAAVNSEKHAKEPCKERKVRTKMSDTSKAKEIPTFTNARSATPLFRVLNFELFYKP